jgi:hypothetical protein
MFLAQNGSNDATSLIVGGISFILVGCVAFLLRGQFQHEMRRHGIGGLFSKGIREPNEAQINGVLQYVILVPLGVGVLSLIVGLLRL